MKSWFNKLLNICNQDQPLKISIKQNQPKPIRVVCLSDTHNQLNRIDVPAGDLLIHAGDFTNEGSLDEFIDFVQCLNQLPHKYKVIVPGNHDIIKDDFYREVFFDYPNCIVLTNAGTRIFNYNIYGCPALPGDKYLIPNNTDILVTHMPPYGILDLTVHGTNEGSYDLLKQVNSVKPRIHIFGHIHESYGIEQNTSTTFINAANCNLFHEPKQKPIIIDLI